MEERPGTGRGTGRGVGRGTAVPSTQSVETTVSTAEEPVPVPGAGRGRGRGLTVAAPTVTSGTPAVVSSTPTAAPVPQATAQVPVAGRGVGRRGLVRAGEPSAGGDAAVLGGGAAPVAEKPGAHGDASAVRSPPARQSAPPQPAAGVAAGMARMDIGSQQQQRGPLAPGTAGGRARGPGGDDRPEPLQGEEGANFERQRREEELRFIDKPKGTAGRRIELATNAVHFEADAKSMVYEYRVDFEPQIWNARLRAKLIESLTDHLPPYLFDFDNLFLAQQLPNEVERFTCASPYADQAEEYKLTIRLVMSNRANESKELLNLVLKNLELAMDFVQIGKNRFDPKHKIAMKEGPNVPAMEVWPGYQTSVNPFTGGILLMTDAQFRVIRLGNAKILMDGWRRQAGNNDQQFQQMVSNYLVGTTVLTPYNNKTYVVGDIMWEMTPMSTFTNSKGEECVFLDYYKKNYNLTIHDRTQPLMYSRPTPTGNKRREGRSVALIPELCQMTGIQDDLRANFAAMKAIATTTKLEPQKRVDSIKRFLNDLDKGQEAQKMLQMFGIKISKELLRAPGRVLQPEQVFCGQGGRGTAVPENGDWTRNATSTKVLEPRDVESWTIIFQNRDRAAAENFSGQFIQIATDFGMRISKQPHIMQINDDRNITYINSVNAAVTANKSSLVLLIFPNSRDDRYAAVKKTCYVQLGIPSQVILSRTLQKPERMRAIVQKIALQINCKLGGSIWRMGKLQIRAESKEDPMRIMVIGVDAYHDLKRKKDAVTAVVASTDQDFSRWHSRCNYQPPKTELGSGLKVSFISALTAYVKANRELPNTIVIFRDGLSDAELDRALHYELPQFTSVCQDPHAMMEILHPDSSSSSSNSSQEVPEYAPEIYFLVVQKRINQRLFLVEKNGLGNPKPGTVCDEVITRRDMYDFYLVPQNVREGSVTPVHFVVVHQPPKPRLSVDDIQGLAYKLTHMYYNWTGTIRVPAPCMYAHKLAYQSGACYERTEHKLVLADQLFYL